jgi:hypothetical protein
VLASNAGMGLQFSAAGALALRWCEEAGPGQVIPAGWFPERTSP